MDISDHVLPEKDYEAIFQVLEDTNVSISELITALLTEKCFKNHSALADLLGNAGDIIAKLLGHHRVSEAARDQACAVVERIYALEIQGLVRFSKTWRALPRISSTDGIDMRWPSGLSAVSGSGMLPCVLSFISALIYQPDNQKFKRAQTALTNTLSSAERQNIPADKDIEKKSRNAFT
jgi:hypothetical protein